MARKKAAVPGKNKGAEAPTGRGKGPRSTQMRTLVKEGLARLRQLQLGYDFPSGETDKTALGLNTIICTLDSLHDDAVFNSFLDKVESQVVSTAHPREMASATLFD